MSTFAEMGVAEALERSIRNAKHLRARDSAAVAAARALARKIDAWEQIVEWAAEDAAKRGGRPLVPANDNVSLSSFLKYLDSLGLLPPDDESVGSGKPAQPAQPSNKVIAFRKRAHGG